MQEEIKNKIIELTKQKASIRSIAKELCISKSKVWRILKKNSGTIKDSETLQEVGQQEVGQQEVGHFATDNETAQGDSETPKTDTPKESETPKKNLDIW